MNITIEEKKQKALELMKKLNIYKPYIKGFEKDNEVCFFEGFGGFWAYQEPGLQEKIKTFEKEHDCLVYAVTHEYLEFGECYDFLYIPDYKEDWDFVLEHQGNMYFAFAYVWTKTVNGARNSARSESELLPAALNVLRKGEKYETDRSKSTSQLNGRKDGPGNIARS